MPARACGTIRIPRESVNRTTTATTIRAIRAAIWLQSSSFGDERGGAVDLHDLDARAGLERVVLIVGAGRPHLTADPHLAAVRVDPLEHHRTAADQCGGAGPDPGRRLQMPARDRPQHEHRS